MISVDVTGLSGVLTALRSIDAKIEKEAGGVLNEISEEILEKSDLIVPFDIGTLSNSKYAERVQFLKGLITQSFGYGGQASDYAEVQHEDLTLQHPNGRQAKYLETPLMQASETFAKTVQDKLFARLGLRA